MTHTTQNTLDLFHNSTDTVSFASGSTILAENEGGKFMYVLQSGQAEIRVHGKAIEEVIPGGVVGEMALVDHQPRSASVVAITDCVLVPVDEKRFMFLIQQTPFFAIQIMKIMVERIRTMNELV